MISASLARRLSALGVEWTPESGDAFCIDHSDFDGEIFTVSEMTVEAHVFDTGTILGFNGTTEWALDSVALEDTLWLPREDQLRNLLGENFLALMRGQSGYRVDAIAEGEEQSFTALDASDAYAEALCWLRGR